MNEYGETVPQYASAKCGFVRPNVLRTNLGCDRTATSVRLRAALSHGCGMRPRGDRPHSGNPHALPGNPDAFPEPYGIQGIPTRYAETRDAFPK